ncbi:MAG: protein-L-isoaspartate(D-aspartate) O-methyltransferase [Pseudomonadota bacterium]
MAAGNSNDKDTLQEGVDRLEIPGLTPEATMGLLLRLREEGIMDPAILKAFETIPRRLFLNTGSIPVPPGPERMAPISCGQVQTAPLIIAHALKALDLRPDMHVLEIGTGSGYQTALLSQLASRIFSIERFRTLVIEAKVRFETLRIKNIDIQLADGEQGWPEEARFDRIIVNVIMPNLNLDIANQLKPGGIVVMPRHHNNIAQLVQFRETNGRFETTPVITGHFLPIIPGIAARL